MASVIVAAASLAVILLTPRFLPRLPGSIIALVLGTGYVGGELVFGENHLFKCFGKEQAKTETPTATPPDKQPLLNPEKVDFVKEIAPVRTELAPARA